MALIPDKNEVFYVVRETNQDDQEFTLQSAAEDEFDTANLDRHKMLIQCTVKFKRIKVITDQEVT